MQCWHRPLSLGFPASSAHVRSKLAVDVGVCSIGSTLPLASTLSLHSLQLDKRLGKRMDGIKKKKPTTTTHTQWKLVYSTFIVCHFKNCLRTIKI